MAANLSNLLRGAARLKARNGGKNLPALIFLTDPERIPDPVTALTALPHTWNGRLAVIYRHFGAADRLEIAKSLKELCGRRRWILLISADAALAARVRADGVHLPEKLSARAVLLRRRRPAWIVTAAAHGWRALLHRNNLDALLLSPAFPTESPSAKGRKVLARRGLSAAVRKTNTPIYALGGVNGTTIRYLENIRRIAGGGLVSGLTGAR